MAGRCKICELDPAERQSLEAALPAALADRVDDEPLRQLAERHAVTMAALRRHAKESHHALSSPAKNDRVGGPAREAGPDESAVRAPAPTAPAGAPLAPPPPPRPMDAPSAPVAPSAHVLAGEGWDGIEDVAPAAPADGGRPWLRPRPARDALDAQVRRLTELVRDPELTFPERVKIEPLLRQALAQLALVSGETKPSDMERLLLSPDFARLMDVVFGWAQRHCPAAYPELIAELRALDKAADTAPDDVQRAA